MKRSSLLSYTYLVVESDARALLVQKRNTAEDNVVNNSLLEDGEFHQYLLRCKVAVCVC